jgi:uncharacterized repeat protein (TIGR01451 family)
MKRHTLWLVSVVGTALCAVLVAAAAAAPGVTPATVTDTLLPGQSKTISKSVETSPIPPRPDILFLADTTGSMGAALTNVQTNATSIMNTVRAAQPDSQFGAAEYRDFDCTDPFAYRLDQSITSSIAAAQAGINAWATGNGCDTPEAQINGLFSAAQSVTGWRSGSSRILVWFGDASGHDPSGGHSLADAIAALQGQNITVIAINVTTSSGDGLNATGQAAAVTAATGGIFFASATPAQVSSTILAGLTNLPATVMPSVACDAGVSASLSPASQTVTSGGTVTFSETYSVAPSTLAGTYVCHVDFLVNGVPAGPAFTETITITVPAPDLKAGKTGPALVTEGHNATYTVTATNLGPTTATGVKITDPIPAGSTFVSASPGCALAAGVVTCTVGTLAPGASQSFSITVLAGSGSSLVNTATVDGDQDDPNHANDSATVTTEINHNPICSGAPTDATLWPPNHKYVAGQIQGVTDPDADVVSLLIGSIMQDEPVDAIGNGDGNTSPDAQIGTNGAYKVRSERAGTGDGRVYVISYSASDSRGGSCTGTIQVSVPHDQSGDPAVNSGATFDSTLP